jgi:hypothetical protein
MTLAPGWRWMSMMTAGWSWCHPPTLLFSSPSMTVATSRSRTGAPLRYAMISERYVSMPVT